MNFTRFRPKFQSRWRTMARVAPFILAFSLLVGGVTQTARSQTNTPTVTLLRVPEGGIQPQAAVDNRGVLHLVYFKGNPAHGDLFYVHRQMGALDARFSPPIRVNSVSGSAIAIGAIRGAQIALGPGGGLRVVWNGSDLAPKGRDGTTPMLYSRLDASETSFADEKNLLVGAEIIDGGGAIAVDSKTGATEVFWHAVAKGDNEAHGAVYVARSAADGKTFSAEEPITTGGVGACGCCGMKAMTAPDGTIYVLFRSATDRVERDTLSLTSRDGGRTFQQTTLQPWHINACPMSLFGLASTPNGKSAVGAWETEGRIYLSRLSAEASANPRPLAASTRVAAGPQKYPTVAVSSAGETLVAWSDGSGWQRGGTLAWQVFDGSGHPVGEPGNVPSGVPTWSLPAAVSGPDGSFVILH